MIKKIGLAIILTVFMTTMVQAADVVISITIPDAFVSRLAAAVGSINCTVVDEAGEVVDTLDPKSCLKRKMLNELGDFINKYEEAQAKQNALDAYNTLYQDWLDNYVPVPVE